MRIFGIVLFCCGLAPAQTLKIGVFSLFRPVELHVEADGKPIVIAFLGSRLRLEGRQGATVRWSQLTPDQNVQVAGPDGSDAEFVLTVPGRIRRHFCGTLTIARKDRSLIAAVAMGLETAVASAVAAESLPGTPIEAMKAQAVATRSYYVASERRHDDFDFCDTTHCQFMRARPAPGSAAVHATTDTRGLVLAYEGKPFPAMFSASCGGETLGLENPDTGYPYYPVRCDYCLRHRRGMVEGHRLGLCQRGAAGMAAESAGFRTILEHYFPGAEVADQAGARSDFSAPNARNPLADLTLEQVRARVYNR